MQVAPRNLRQGNHHLSIYKRDFGRGRGSAQTFSIDKFSRDQQDENKRTGVHRSHPQTLSTDAPSSLASLGGRRGNRGRLAPLDFKQHHKRRQCKNGYEKEPVVGEDGADNRHFPLGGGKQSIYRELVQS